MKTKILLPTILTAATATIAPIVCSCSNNKEVTLVGDSLNGPYDSCIDMHPYVLYNDKEKMLNDYLTDVSNNKTILSDDLICSTLFGAGDEYEVPVNYIRSTTKNVDVKEQRLTFTLEFKYIVIESNKQVYKHITIDVDSIKQGITGYDGGSDAFAGPIIEPAYLLIDSYEEQKAAGIADEKGSLHVEFEEYNTGGATDIYDYDHSKIETMSDEDLAKFAQGTNFLPVLSAYFMGTVYVRL